MSGDIERLGVPHREPMSTIDVGAHADYCPFGKLENSRPIGLAGTA
jgi:hypothetical protein